MALALCLERAFDQNRRVVVVTDSPKACKAMDSRRQNKEQISFLACSLLNFDLQAEKEKKNKTVFFSLPLRLGRGLDGHGTGRGSGPRGDDARDGARGGECGHGGGCAGGRGRGGEEEEGKKKKKGEE